MGKAAMLCVFLVIVQTREDMILIRRANPPENQMLEDLRQRLIADNADYDSFNTTTSSTSHLPAKCIDPQERSEISHTDIRRYIPQQVAKLPFLPYGKRRKMPFTENTNQPFITSSRTLDQSPIHDKSFEIYPRQPSTRLQRHAPLVPLAQTRENTALTTIHSEERNVLRRSNSRRNYDHSENDSKVKTPLTDALKKGIKLIEKFERGNMAKKQFMDNWMIMNDIIQDAMKSEHFHEADPTPESDTPSNILAHLREKLKKKSRLEKEKLQKKEHEPVKLTLRQKSEDDVTTEETQPTTVSPLDKQLRLHQKDKDKHFLAYRYRPTTKSKARRTTKTFKIYAAYKKSTRNRVHQDTTEVTIKRGLRLGGKRKLQTHPHQSTPVHTTRKTIKGFKLSNGAQDVLDVSDTFDDDAPWKEDTSITNKIHKRSTTHTPTPLLEVHWVKHSDNNKKKATQKEESLQENEQRKGLPEQNTVQKNESKTLQEDNNEKILKKLKMPREESTQENSSQEKPVKKTQQLYDINSPQEESKEIDPNIDEDKSPQQESKENTLPTESNRQQESKESTLPTEANRQQKYKKSQKKPKNTAPQMKQAKEKAPVKEIKDSPPTEPKQERGHHSKHEPLESVDKTPKRTVDAPADWEDLLDAVMRRTVRTYNPLHVVRNKERLKKQPVENRWYARSLLD